MGQVRSEAVTLLVARETVPGTLPTADWLQLQPNPGGITDFDANTTRVESDPLSKFMSLEKGDIVDLSAAPKIATNLNKDAVDYFATDMYRSVAKHAGNTGQSLYRPTAVTATGYTVAANGALTAGLLIHAKGFPETANNGIKPVAAASTGTEIKAAGLTANAAPPANVTVEVAGVQGGAGDIGIDVDGNITATTLNLSTLGLQVGQEIIIGDETSGAAYGFATAAYNGRAFVKVIAAGKLTLEHRSWTVGAADAGAGKTIRLLFTRWYRNVAMGHADELESTSSMELEEPGLGAGGVSTFTYARGLSLKTAEIDAPLASKITLSLTFEGMDVDSPVLAADRAVGANAALLPLATALFDTSTDLRKIRLLRAETDVVLANEINSWKLTLETNVKPKKMQGVLGSAGAIHGKFTPMVSMEAYATSDEIAKVRRDNGTAWWDVIIGNDQGGYGFALHACGVTGGTKTYANGELVMYSGLQITGFRDPLTNIVSSLSVFAYVPTSLIS